MTENTKTLSLVVAAMAVLLLAVATRPKPPAATTEDLVGKALFPALSDPLKARRMRIVTFDEGTSRVREFEVAQAGGVWALPSHKNYPADAKDQMAEAAGSLVDLKVLGVASKDARDHELYGVVEPDAAKDQFGQKGIGKLVALEDESNKPLARMIIGKADKTSRPDEFGGQPAELRFVRIPGQDPVYRVALATDKFSTHFSDWIETDLLKINPWDIQEVRLRDYSVSDALTPSGDLVPMLNRRADLQLGYDDREGKWALKDLVEYKKNKPEKAAPGADDQPDSARLNEMKDALDNLKIVDVARKPAQMSASLQADREFLNEEEALRDLTRRGFLPVPTADNQVDIVSNDGEVTVSMKDGVEYVLRFGAIAGIESASDAEKQEEAKKSEPAGKADAGVSEGTKAADHVAAESTSASGDGNRNEASKSGGLSRYILVMAQFNPDLIPKPELEPLPEIKKAPPKAADAKSPPAKGADAGQAGTAKKEDAKSTNAPEEDDLEALEAQRDRIEKENRRMQDQYDEQLSSGRQRAKELNARFADWYYVVNDATYRKIHLGKADIIRKKSKDPAESAAPKNPFDLRGLPGAAPQ